MLPIIIVIAVGLGVTALIGGVALALRPAADHAMEDRLAVLTGAAHSGREGRGQSAY